MILKLPLKLVESQKQRPRTIDLQFDDLGL